MIYDIIEEEVKKMSLQERRYMSLNSESREKIEEEKIKREAARLYLRAISTSSLNELRQIRNKLYELYIRKQSPEVHAYIEYVEAKIRDTEFEELKEQLTTISEILGEIIKAIQDLQTALHNFIIRT